MATVKPEAHTCPNASDATRLARLCTRIRVAAERRQSIARIDYDHSMAITGDRPLPKQYLAFGTYARPAAQPAELEVLRSSIPGERNPESQSGRSVALKINLVCCCGAD